MTSSDGVEEWVEIDPNVLPAPPRTLTLAEKIAATRAQVASDTAQKAAALKASAAQKAHTEVEAESEPEPAAPPRKLTLAEQIAPTRAKVASDTAQKARTEVEAESVPEPAASPQKLILAEQIAATRAKVASDMAQKARTEEGAESEPEPAAPPRKLTLAEQIAAARAKAATPGAGSTPMETKEDAKAARAARAAEKAQAEAAEVAEEARAEEAVARKAKDDAKLAAAEEVLRLLAEAEVEVKAGTRKLTLAEQISGTRARAAIEAAGALAIKAKEQTSAVTVQPTVESGSGAQAQISKGFEWCSGDGGAGAVPSNIKAAVDAGRVDEVHILLANVPPFERSRPAYKALRKELMEQTKDNASKRAKAKGKADREVTQLS